MSRRTRCKRVYGAIFRSLRVASSLPAVAPLDGSFAANFYYRASLRQSLKPNKHQEIYFYDHFATKDYYICAVNWIKLLHFVVSRMSWVSTSVSLREPFTFYVDETVRLRLLGFYLSPVFRLLCPSLLQLQEYKALIIIFQLLPARWKSSRRNFSPSATGQIKLRLIFSSLCGS